MTDRVSRVRTSFATLATLATLSVSLASAQQKTPYAGQEDRPIKALSDSEIMGYLNGEGMGYAKAAELNRFPGPRHVLDLADSLGLTEPQKNRVRAIYDSMHVHAVTLGSQIVAREAVLDSLFSTGAIDDGRLRSLVAEVARLQGELRATHLGAHLAVTRLLAPEQIRAYERLRGYEHGSHEGHQRGG